MNKRLLLLLACLIATPVVAQPPARCEAPEFRQFDFWIGEWTVRNADGALLGHNTITRIANGCGLLEDWTGAQGGVGMSINAFDGTQWTQRWVGAGVVLWIVGGLDEDGAMVMTATEPRATARGEVIDRITWTPLDDGRVLQAWDISTDGGTEWTRTFAGYYANE